MTDPHDATTPAAPRARATHPIDELPDFRQPRPRARTGHPLRQPCRTCRFVPPLCRPLLATAQHCATPMPRLDREDDGHHADKSSEHHAITARPSFVSRAQHGGASGTHAMSDQRTTIPVRAMQTAHENFRARGGRNLWNDRGGQPRPPRNFCAYELNFLNNVNGINEMRKSGGPNGRFWVSDGALPRPPAGMPREARAMWFERVRVRRDYGLDPAPDGLRDYLLLNLRIQKLNEAGERPSLEMIRAVIAQARRLGELPARWR
jgi:hypothetical protein